MHPSIVSLVSSIIGEVTMVFCFLYYDPYMACCGLQAKVMQTRGQHLKVKAVLLK
jgi:hypothetical protein